MDFISTLPFPINYGSIEALIGLDGNLLDALVLDPRLFLGITISISAWGTGRSGCNRYEGWRGAEDALARATPPNLR